LSIIHVQDTATSNNCTLLLESNFNYSNVGSVFDERSDIAFAGYTSITETLDPNVYKRLLATVTGSNDFNTKTLKGRLDLCTNNDTNTNGVESRLAIVHTGNVGVDILNPTALFNVSPEIRNASNEINTITNAVLSAGNTIITLSNNIFSGISTEMRNALIAGGGNVIILNNTFLMASIISIPANNQIVINGNKTGTIGCNIYVHYSGLNVIKNGGLVGVNTNAPTSMMDINGSISMPIITTVTNLTLDMTHYTVICNTTSGNITITLPATSTAIAGRMYRIKNGSTSGNTVTVQGNGALIDGAASYTITYSGGVMGYNTFQTDGVAWWVV
jgi:hypothetical protein